MAITLKNFYLCALIPERKSAFELRDQIFDGFFQRGGALVVNFLVTAVRIDNVSEGRDLAQSDQLFVVDHRGERGALLPVIVTMRSLSSIRRGVTG